MVKRRRFSELLLLAASLLLSFVILEGGLRLFTVFPITVESNKMAHDQLGYTLHPEFSDIDYRGFRNKAYRLEESDLVIIGDSHAYGENVNIEQNFPSIVAKKTGRNVYNFGVGSYGIYQYKLLIEEAARFPVKEIILAFYPVNDLSLSCEVTQTSYWKAYAKENKLKLPRCRHTNRDREESAPQSVWLKLTQVLKQTATVQILVHILPQNFLQQLGGDDKVSNATHYVFEDDQSVKKNRVRWHNKLTSLSNPDVLISFNNSKVFLLNANKLLADASIGFVVLIIPSKELVLHEWLARRGLQGGEEFEKLVQNEVNLVREYMKFFKQTNIAFFYALPHLAEALSKANEYGETFYKTNNGHPLEAGYRAYADAALKALNLIRDTERVN